LTSLGSTSWILLLIWRMTSAPVGLMAYPSNSGPVSMLQK
jgi:hypothetical protein